MCTICIYAYNEDRQTDPCVRVADVFVYAHAIHHARIIRCFSLRGGAGNQVKSRATMGSLSGRVAEVFGYAYTIHRETKTGPTVPKIP